MVRLVLPVIRIPVVTALMHRGRHKAFLTNLETGFDSQARARSSGPRRFPDNVEL
jgi:hypothetical protein